MEDSTQTENTRSRLLEKVQVRRGTQIIKDVSVKTLISGVKMGKLRRSDEFSSDGKNWTVLGMHRQLSPLFPPDQPEIPIQVKKEFVRLADMIKDINK